MPSCLRQATQHFCTEVPPECSLGSMARRIVALALILVIGLCSVEVLLPGEVRADSSTARPAVDAAAGVPTPSGERVDCDCLCACGCLHAQVVVLAHAMLPLGPNITHNDALADPSLVGASVDPAPQFRPPRA
jgi:hypothetical protein